MFASFEVDRRFNVQMSHSTSSLENDTSKYGLTLRQRNLIEAACALEVEQAKNAGPDAFIAQFLAQATLPHRDPLTNYFERGNKFLTLSITAHPAVGVPYGGLPRLLLAWMCTEAVRTQSPELSLGRSQSSFLEKLGLPNDGKYISRVRDQSLRLVRSMISVSSASNNAVAIENIVIAKKAFLFWHARETDEPSRWDSTLTLSTDFFDSIKRSAVPVRMDALRYLKHSPFAMDIYTWLVYRMYILRISSKPVVRIPFEGLREQFGAGYALGEQGGRDFKKMFLVRLNEALMFYPEARDHVVAINGNLVLTPAKLHISKRKPRF